MSEEELDAAGALAVDEDQDELMEEMSIEERKERLKKTRWVCSFTSASQPSCSDSLSLSRFHFDWDDFGTG